MTAMPDAALTESGYWAMLRINDDFAGYETITTAISGAGVQRTLINPPVFWA